MGCITASWEDKGVWDERDDGIWWAPLRTKALRLRRKIRRPCGVQGWPSLKTISDCGCYAGWEERAWFEGSNVLEGDFPQTGIFRTWPTPINTFYPTIHQRIHQLTKQWIFENLNRLRNLIFYYYQYLIGNRRSRAGLISWIVACNFIKSYTPTPLSSFTVSSTASFSSSISNSIPSSNLLSLLSLIKDDRVFFLLLLLTFRLGFRDCLLDIFFLCCVFALLFFTCS